MLGFILGVVVTYFAVPAYLIAVTYYHSRNATFPPEADEWRAFAWDMLKWPVTANKYIKEDMGQ